MAGEIFTIGHSTRSIPEFAEMLQMRGVQLLIDVRKIPRSRTNPQFNLDTLAASLSPWQIEHHYIPELGGRRNRSFDVAPAVNGFWHDRSFHNYADYALSDDFASGFTELTELASQRPTAIMCSEAVWWRCHRRIIADYLISLGWRVLHLMGDGRVESAKMTPAATRDDERLIYPASGG